MRDSDRRRGRRLTAVGAAVVLLASAALSGCGADSDVPELMWYTNPDNGGQARFAQECSEASGGAYRIKTSILPREASDQREQLVRRLAAQDESISMISMDPPFIPEFADAGFIKPLPQDVAAEVTDGVVQSAIEGSTWKGDVVAAPFYANTQLLWYRKSLAKKAGLDMSKPVSWEQLMEAANKLDTNLGVQGIRAEALTVWVNALVTSGGGRLVANPKAAPDKMKMSMNSPAGRKAAEIIGTIGRQGLGGSALSTADEPANNAMFEQGNALAMVNWPDSYAQAKSHVEDGTMDKAIFDDYGWTRFPSTEEGKPSKPPYGGINIAVGAYTPYPDEAFDAVRCIVSTKNQARYMIDDGNPAAKKAAYDDPKVRKNYPTADVIRESLEAAEPRPMTPYYNEVSQGIQRTWHTPASVRPDTSPAEADDLIEKVLRKEELL